MMSKPKSPTTNYQLPTTNPHGFTLLELLVVSAIIGILFSIAVASFSTAQKKARDAKRREDMKAIQNAFEQYYAANGSYPSSCPSPGATLTIETGNVFVIPSDPKGDVEYTPTSCSSNGYCYCAKLEEKDTGNSSNDSCNFASSGDYFCVKNLQ